VPLFAFIKNTENPPHNTAGDFMLDFLQVPPLVGNMLVQAGDLKPGGFAPAAALHLTGGMALQDAQLDQTGLEPARVLDPFTDKQCHQRVQAHIQPDSPDRLSARLNLPAGQEILIATLQSVADGSVSPEEALLLIRRWLNYGQGQAVETEPKEQVQFA
jgi:hypothetical protein